MTIRLIALLLTSSVSISALAIVPASFLGQPKSLDNYTLASLNKMVAAGGASRTEKVERLVQRSLAYSNLLRFHEALDDLNQAVRQDPAHVKAHYLRGVVYARLGQSAQAHADFDRALRLDPKYLPAILQSGYLYFLNGNYESAQKQFTHFLKEKPGDLYRALWIYLCEQYLHRDGNSLRFYTQDSDLNPWPGAMVKLYLGDVGLIDLVDALKKTLKSWKPENRCEAYFYLGQYHYLHGEFSQALAYFEEAVKTRQSELIEYEFSLVYIDSIKKNRATK